VYFFECNDDIYSDEPILDESFDVNAFYGESYDIGYIIYLQIIKIILLVLVLPLKMKMRNIALTF
jgi:hypothetical protein